MMFFREHVQVEEVIRSEHVEGQYFIMYFKHEGENFNPEQIFGVDGADEAAHIVSRFRATGLLLKPELRYFPPRSRADRSYEVIADVISIYVLNTMDALYKIKRVELMSRKDAEEYTAAQKEARKNITRFMEDPE